MLPYIWHPRVMRMLLTRIPRRPGITTGNLRRRFNLQRQAHSLLTLLTRPIRLTLTQRSRRRIHATTSLLTAVTLVVTSFMPSAGIPQAQQQQAGAAASSPSGGSQSTGANNLYDYNPPLPQPITVPPLQDPHLPALTIKMDVAPRSLSVGDPLTITLTINNEANDPANNLSVSMPLPAGTMGFPDPAPNGWSWQRARLDARSAVTFTATLRLIQPPPGDAVLARVQAAASGLAAPVVEEGGAVVVPPIPAQATARFIPGSPARLRSVDGRSEIYVPADAASQPLTLTHALQGSQRNPTPRGIAGRKQGLPTCLPSTSTPRTIWGRRYTSSTGLSPSPWVTHHSSCGR